MYEIRKEIMEKVLKYSVCVELGDTVNLQDTKWSIGKKVNTSQHVFKKVYLVSLVNKTVWLNKIDSTKHKKKNTHLIIIMVKQWRYVILLQYWYIVQSKSKYSTWIKFCSEKAAGGAVYCRSSSQSSYCNCLR